MGNVIEERIPFSQKTEKKLILLWSFTVWLVVMNTTMFNVALPSIIQDLSLSSTSASWIVSGYSIMFAITSLTYSRLSDFIPIRKLMFIALFILGVASVIGVLTQHFYFLLFARLLQALGAGAVPALAVVLASRYIPISRRGQSMAYIASGASLGFGLGPVFGGMLTQWIGWNFLFLVTLLVLLLLPFYIKWLPKEQPKKGKFDFIGAILTAISFTSLLLFLSFLSLSIFIIGIISIWLLWKHIHGTSMPFIQPAIIKNKSLLTLLFLGFTGFMFNFATLFLIPIILSVIYDLNAAVIGYIIFPGAILSAILAPVIGRCIDKFGNSIIMLVGHILLFLACILFISFLEMSPLVLLFGYVFVSIGFSSLHSSNTNEISRILPKEHLGGGLGFSQLIQFFGGGFGVTLAASVIMWQENLQLDFIYRNIFIGLMIWVSISFLVFYRYGKGKTSNQL